MKIIRNPCATSQDRRLSSSSSSSSSFNLIESMSCSLHAAQLDLALWAFAQFTASTLWMRKIRSSKINQAPYMWT